MRVFLQHLVLLSFFPCSCLLGCRTINKCEITKVPYQGGGDTTAVIFQGRVAFYTTANRVSGTVVDRATYLPLKNAEVILEQANRVFLDTTDAAGAYAIFKNDFEGIWRMQVREKDHICLQVDSVIVGGGQTLILKLK